MHNNSVEQIRMVLLPSLMNQAENGVIWVVIMIITWTWLLKTKQWLNLIAVESLITGQKAMATIGKIIPVDLSKHENG